VKNQFKVADTIGNYLDAYYYLTHCLKIDSWKYWPNEFGQLYGTELNVNWSNRNVFRG
jgi:hypothetical protein